MHLCNWRLDAVRASRGRCRVWVSASWRSADQRQAVDRAFGAFRRLQHVQVIAGDSRAERDTDRVVAARMRERHGAVRDVKRLAAVALDAHVVDARIVGQRNLRHRVGEIARLSCSET